MFQQIADMLTNAVAVCVYWVTLFFNKTGMVGLFIAVFVIYQSFRLLLAPLVGQASSDTVRGWYSGTKLGRYNANKRMENAPRRSKKGR